MPGRNNLDKVKVTESTKRQLLRGHRLCSEGSGSHSSLEISTGPRQKGQCSTFLKKNYIPLERLSFITRLLP